MAPPLPASYSPPSRDELPSQPHRGCLASWPGPDPVELAEGSLVTTATTPRPGIVVLRAVGEIDMLTAPGWRRANRAAMRVARSPEVAPAAPPRELLPRLVCDLSTVTFLGASALAVLDELADDAECPPLDLCLVVGERAAVRRPLQLTGFDQRLQTTSSLDRAVSASPVPASTP